MPFADDPLATGTFDQVANVWHDATSLETLVRPLLETVLELTNLDIAYLTVKHADDGLEHRFIADPTGFGLPEGATIPWDDSLCKRCQEADLRWTDDVTRDLPPSAIAEAFNVRTFLTVPVVGQDGTLLGTLCSASVHAKSLNDTTIAELELLARLIGDWMGHERQLQIERSRADAAEAALDARAMLIARAEHELKTPLALLTGWAQMMDERWQDLGDAERTAGISAMRRGTDQLHRQVQRLLDEARADVQIRRLELVAIDVAAIARDVVSEVASVTANHDVSIVLDVSAVALGDAEALRQIIVHLLENAVKYSPEGGSIEVRVLAEEESVALTVSDQGIGVSEQVDVFEPFVRGEANGSIRGTGLGLHIVKSFAVGMGGAVAARRNEGRGSTFTLRLPSVAR